MIYPDIPHIIIGFILILLMGIDFITTEYGVTHAGCTEVNPIMKKIAGKPKIHFALKSIVTGFVVGDFWAYPATWEGYAMSITGLYILCFLAGVVQIYNIRQIFIVGKEW